MVDGLDAAGRKSRSATGQRYEPGGTPKKPWKAKQAVAAHAPVHIGRSGAHKNSPIGFVKHALAVVTGFAMIWHIGGCRVRPAWRLRGAVALRLRRQEDGRDLRAK